MFFCINFGLFLIFNFLIYKIILFLLLTYASKTLYRFEDIEKEVSENAPSVVYKYHDWSNPYHQALLKEGKVWFAHPFDYNDVEDIRPDIIFDESEMFEPAYFEKMLATAGMATAEENHTKASE